MTFINNRLDFFNGESYGEVQHANAFAKGMPNFVAQGLELTGNTLSSGIFNNTGTFGQLGSVNETHTITANYTGFIVIESTLSGRTSTSRIIESPTFLSTDPRTASNVRYFTIYELNNGSIINDFRHIDYVKSFEVKNIGGSQFVFILNGFVSAPFDASVLAGNRTLINEIDIGYDDTIHTVTPLQDILKDLFDKSKTIIGNDKPFELSFLIGTPTSTFSPKLGEKIIEFINSEYGAFQPSYELMKFQMNVSTAKGMNNLSYSNCNKCSIWGTDFYFEWVFDYDNWANVIVRDAKGYLSENPEMLYTSSGNMGTDITLSDSIYNFEKITCSITDEVGGSGDGMVYINVLGSGRLTFQEAIQGAEGYYLYLTVFNSDVSGKNLTSNNNIYSRKYTHISGQLLIEDLYLHSVSGLNRIYPIGTTHSLETIDGKLYKKITLPNGEVTLKETKIQQDFYVSDDK